MFDEQLFPVLTPLAVDPAHPFPYISNLSLNLAVVVRAPGELTRRIARVKVPPLLPRFVVLPDGERFVPARAADRAAPAALFPGMEIVEHSPFRVTRNADYDIDVDEAEDMVAAVESVLRRDGVVRRCRPAGGRLVDVGRGARAARCASSVSTTATSTASMACSISAGSGRSLALDRPELKYEPWTPVTQARLVAADDSDRPTSSRSFARATCSCTTRTTRSRPRSRPSSSRPRDDPDVLAIKQTLYRTSADERRSCRR